MNTDSDHFDQLSPIDGVHQVTPEGAVVPVSPPVGDTPGSAREEGRQEVEAPTLPPQYRSEDFQLSALQQVAAAREALAQPAGNVDIQGAPHFLRNVNGAELCGQCGTDFPCDTYREMSEERQRAEFGRTLLQMPPTMAEAALAAGMSQEEFRDRLQQARRQ